MLYLRRQNLDEAVEKLKRGESIGPVTKAAMEAENTEDKGDKENTSREKTKDDDVQSKEDDTEGTKHEVRKEGVETEDVATKDGKEVPEISIESIQVHNVNSHRSLRGEASTVTPSSRLPHRSLPNPRILPIHIVQTH